jgi:putative sterol carrier protein
MAATFIQDKATGVNAVVQFDITGEGGGQWHADIVDGELKVVEGLHDSPRLTLSASADDYIAIAEGKLNDQLAFMTGRIRAKGDLAFAMKMQKMFKR